MQYTVAAGDSFARIAGSQLGDQRQLWNLAGLNGGLGRVLHVGDVIDLPDGGFAPNPTVSQSQFNAAPTGYSGNQAEYRNQNAGSPATPGTSTRPGMPAIGGPAVPPFGSSGVNPNGQGQAYVGQVDASSMAPGNSAGTYDRRNQNRPTTTPNSAGTYDPRHNYPGAMPSNQGAGYNANPNQWAPLPGARGAPGSPTGPMGGGAQTQNQPAAQDIPGWPSPPPGFNGNWPYPTHGTAYDAYQVGGQSSGAGGQYGLPYGGWAQTLDYKNGVWVPTGK